jgi:hypothetical protein
MNVTTKNKVIIFSIFLVTGYSNPSKNELVASHTTDISEGLSLLNTDETISYLTRQEIKQFIEKAPFVKIDTSFPIPFENLDFNKVIAYDYDGIGDRYPSVVNKSGQFVDVVTKQKALNAEQVKRFITLISDEKSYGGTTAACFDPGWALVFFKDNKIVFVVDICLDCNSINSTKPIPATSVHNEVFEDYTLPREGFSLSTRKSIQSLSKELDMKYGDYQESSIFDE